MNTDDLTRRLRNIELLARGPDLPITAPPLPPPDSLAGMKRVKDDAARAARKAAAEQAEEQARAEREAAERAEAERKARNAPQVAKLREEIVKLEAKRAPITEQIREKYAELGGLL